MMLTNEQRSARGFAAETEWAQLEAAFKAMRESIVEEIAQTSPMNEAKVLNLHKSLCSLEAVRFALIAIVNDGVAARQAIAMAGMTRVHVP